MVVSVITVISLTLLIAGKTLKNSWMLLMATMSWIIFAFVAVEYTFDNVAISSGLLMLGGSMAIISAVMALTTWMSLRPGQPEDKQELYKRRILKITRRKPRYPY